jgi:hypothetical protein
MTGLEAGLIIVIVVESLVLYAVLTTTSRMLRQGASLLKQAQEIVHRSKENVKAAGLRIKELEDANSSDTMH